MNIRSAASLSLGVMAFSGAISEAKTHVRRAFPPALSKVPTFPEREGCMQFPPQRLSLTDAVTGTVIARNTTKLCPADKICQAAVRKLEVQTDEAESGRGIETWKYVRVCDQPSLRGRGESGIS